MDTATLFAGLVARRRMGTSLFQIEIWFIGIPGKIENCWKWLNTDYAVVKVQRFVFWKRMLWSWCYCLSLIGCGGFVILKRNVFLNNGFFRREMAVSGLDLK